MRSSGQLGEPSVEAAQKDERVTSDFIRGLEAAVAQVEQTAMLVLEGPGEISDVATNIRFRI